MMIRRIGLALCLMCAGCSQDAERNLPKAPERDVVFLRAGDWSLTAGMVSNRVMVLAKLAELRGKPIKEKAFAQWANQQAMRNFLPLLSEHLLVNEMNRRGIVATPADEQEILKRYNKWTRQKAATLAECAKKFGDQEARFLEKAQNEARFKAFEREALRIEISDQDVLCELARIKVQKKRVDEANAKAKARGAAAYEELKGGSSWEAVAAKYSEDALQDKEQATYSKDWIDYKMGQGGFPEFDKALPHLKKGDFSQPLDTDEGLLILRVNELSPDGVYSLARILIRLMYEIELPESNAALKAQLYREEYNQRQRDLVAELQAKVKMEYPMGTNFVYHIWPEPKGGKGNRFLRQLLNQTKKEGVK